MSINQPPFTLDHPLHFTPTTYGSASFMSRDEANSLGLTEQVEGKKFCPYVGTMVLNYQLRLHAGSYIDEMNSVFLYARKATSWQGYMEPELQEGNGHLLTIAPTRAGKGTGQIINNLLTWVGSVLVIDIKGENHHLSAEYRTQILQQKVVRFAPFEEKSAIWNPIMSIRAIPDTDPEGKESTPEEEEDTRYLTNLLITPSGSSGSLFWENSAKNFLEGLLLYVRTAPIESKNLNNNDPKPNSSDQKLNSDDHKVRERSMREVRRLLSLKKKRFKKLLTAMGKSKRTLISQAGNTFKGFMSGEGKLGQSILATALEQTAVWAYQRVHKATYKQSEEHTNMEPAPNDFTFSEMRDVNTSIYLIIPPEYLTEYRSVLRVMIGFAMRELRISYEESKEENKPPVLFILDEFPQLAYMRPIEEALLYLAGYGVRFWFFVQDISQLQLHYKDSWRTFFANTGTQCFFGVSDIATASLVSEMAGTTTVQHTTYTNGSSTNVSNLQLYYLSKNDLRFHQIAPFSWNKSATFADNSTEGQLYWYSLSDRRYYPLPQNSLNNSTTIADTSRPLITPDEVMRMYDYEQIVFMKGLKPIRCYRPNYYEFCNLKKYSEIKPGNEINFI